jgi:hypothetical protein
MALAKCTSTGLGLDPLLRAVPSASAYVVGEAEETAVPNQGAREIVAWYDEDPARQQADARLDAVMDELAEAHRL